MYWIEIIGTFAFAISGIRLAAAKQFDLFGLFIVGFVTAVGGGTIRDVMLGVRPFWFDDLMSLFIVAGALVLYYFFHKLVDRIAGTIFLFDTIGLAIFTLLIAGLFTKFPEVATASLLFIFMAPLFAFTTINLNFTQRNLRTCLRCRWIGISVAGIFQFQSGRVSDRMRSWSNNNPPLSHQISLATSQGQDGKMIQLGPDPNCSILEELAVGVGFFVYW